MVLNTYLLEHFPVIVLSAISAPLKVLKGCFLIFTVNLSVVVEVCPSTLQLPSPTHPCSFLSYFLFLWLLIFKARAPLWIRKRQGEGRNCVSKQHENGFGFSVFNHVLSTMCVVTASLSLWALGSKDSVGLDLELISSLSKRTHQCSSLFCLEKEAGKLNSVPGSSLWRRCNVIRIQQLHALTLTISFWDMGVN